MRLPSKKGRKVKKSRFEMFLFLNLSEVMVPLDGVVYLSTTCYLYIQGSHWVDIDHNVVDVLEILLWIIFAKISLAAL